MRLAVIIYTIAIAIEMITIEKVGELIGVNKVNRKQFHLFG
jgi:hypothetical protein